MDEDLAVVVVNLGAWTSQAHVDVTQDLPAGSVFDSVDWISGERYRWTRDALLDRGLYVRLEGGRGHLFTVAKAS